MASRRMWKGPFRFDAPSTLEGMAFSREGVPPIGRREASIRFGAPFLPGGMPAGEIAKDPLLG